VSNAPQTNPAQLPAKWFEVVRKLGSGSYAVVYLVREVLSPSFQPQDDDNDDTQLAFGDELELDVPAKEPVKYGREFAIKCLSKANLNHDALEAQLFEATVHQSLPPHPNIVTLYRTLETDSFLLLLLECVPGEDLFYFLEQARDHSDEQIELFPEACPSVTPPTPSLLSSLHPAQLLSHNRLRLIASMFSQMCDAVAHCHRVSVFHRDIKPENFIVTDGYTEGLDGRRERRVIVKLTDFGLATTEPQSTDMDCGSAPYMSYECRNNCAPTYSTRAADVWSLGFIITIRGRIQLPVPVLLLNHSGNNPSTFSCNASPA
jgi:serine/threonine protein kinase